MNICHCKAMSALRNKSVKFSPGTETEKQKSKIYFHRLVAYMMTITPYFLQKYIEQIVLQCQPLHKYLEQKKHSIFHMFDTRDCCECLTQQEFKQGDVQKLTKVQFTTLYEINKNKKIKCTKSTKWICPCIIRVNQRVKINSLDISLICCIFDHDTRSGAKLWIETIRVIRNKIFHLGNPFCIDKLAFEYYWTRLSGSTGGIARLLYCTKLLNEKEKAVVSIKLTAMSCDHIETAQTFLTEEYQRKCQELELKLLSQVNESVRRLSISPEKEKLEFLFKRIDMQTILLWCTLDVPIYWDEEEIAEAGEKVIESHNEQHRNVRILSMTTGDLNTVLEIKKRVMRKIEELEFEMAQLVSEILESSKIDVPLRLL